MIAAVKTFHCARDKALAASYLSRASVCAACVRAARSYESQAQDIIICNTTAT